MSKLSTDTIAIVIAIVAVGATLAGLNLATVGDLRNEARADRAAWQSESRQLRDEARADREAFERHITRLTQEQGRLNGIVEQMRTAQAGKP